MTAQIITATIAASFLLTLAFTVDQKVNPHISMVFGPIDIPLIFRSS